MENNKVCSVCGAVLPVESKQQVLNEIKVLLGKVMEFVPLGRPPIEGVTFENNSSFRIDQKTGELTYCYWYEDGYGNANSEDHHYNPLDLPIVNLNSYRDIFKEKALWQCIDDITDKEKEDRRIRIENLAKSMVDGWIKNNEVSNENK
jgi:hypothetical protein